MAAGSEGQSIAGRDESAQEKSATINGVSDVAGGALFAPAMPVHPFPGTQAARGQQSKVMGGGGAPAHFWIMPA